MPAPQEVATAFAPATVANVAVGFDVLGYAFAAIGDRVRVARVEAPGVSLTVQGIDLPTAPERNTAGRALLAMIEGLGLTCGFDVTIEKGIPLSSGLGGSAASAVGAVVAANALLDAGCGLDELYAFAMEGEAVASGGYHGDNVAPCLFGGFVGVLPGDRRALPFSLPLPDGLVCVTVRPHVELDTRSQRAVLPARIPLALYAEQAGWLAGFVAALYSGNAGLLERCMRDVVVGPHRSVAIPAFDAMDAAAREAGAVGFGIAGSGPTVFAWAPEARLAAVQAAMTAAVGGPHDVHCGVIGGPGARVVEEDA